METKRISVRQLLIAIIKSGLLTFGLYLIGWGIIGALLEDIDNKTRSNIYYFLVLIFYAGSFYFFHTNKQNRRYELNIDTKKNFDIRQEMKNYFRSEGLALTAIYGILSIINEIGFIIVEASEKTRNAIGMILFPLFPLTYSVINIPVIRSLTSFAVIVIISVTVTIISRRRLFNKWKVKNKINT